MMEESTSGRPANMMPFMDAMKSGFKNSFTLSGRASRSEYWYWVLGGFIFQMVMLVGSIVLAIVEVPVLPALMALSPIPSGFGYSITGESLAGLRFS